MNIAEPTPVDTSEATALTAVRAVCKLIPPLFNLENFVAVNPFLGWSDTPLLEASGRIFAGLDAEVLPPIDHYRKKWELNQIDQRDVVQAALRHGLEANSVLKVLYESQSKSGTAFNSAENDLAKITQRFVSRSLAAIFRADFPLDPNDVYRELIKRAAIDKSFELSGLAGWSRWIKSAPEEYVQAITWVTSKRQREDSEFNAHAYRLLGAQYGWASFLRGMGWNSGPNELSLVEALCAALLVFDQAIRELNPGASVSDSPTQKDQGDLSIRLCLQDACEDRLLKSQLAALPAVSRTSPVERPEFQVVFCIDVRSEIIRRKLEALSPNIETVGFAGFFGVSARVLTDGLTSPRCPVLLNPQVEIQAKGSGFVDALRVAFRSTYSSPGAFNLVETLGIGSVRALLTQALGLSPKVHGDAQTEAEINYAENRFGLTLAERVGMAESILVNSGIGHRLGQIVTLCGHGGRSTNNAHEASLDCGACGGHCGALNAQMAVEVLNDPQVQAELAIRGFKGILETLFVAAQHDTSTDEVSVFQPRGASEAQSRKIAELEALLGSASASGRVERARAMGVEGAKDLLAALDRKANDWSEVRPEWGLARNASFIAARRFRTRGANLDGRAFLHDYDASQDHDDQVLTLILNAPVVVASWINLQYFASTVDNERFGCGTKALLNRVGNIGVISGNEGDLRPGLPRESVYNPDGSWFHDPVRLQVIVEASSDKIDRALSKAPGVADLVSNGWLRLLSLDTESSMALLKQSDGTWVGFTPE